MNITRNIKRQTTSSNKCLLTLSTCWYNLKSKFTSKVYINWIKNLLSIVNNFKLVIYTDVESFKQIKSIIDLTNINIKIIIKPLEEFYTYKYKDNWILNHRLSNLHLHSYIDWKLNMLWNEKVFLVNETIKNGYFDSMYYGWCDIGYFRNRKNDLNIIHLLQWPNDVRLLNNTFNIHCIHYGCVQRNVETIRKLSNEIKTHYCNKLTNHQSMQLGENCFAGGFFMLCPKLIDEYVRLYIEKLEYYFMKNFIIKDDQTIIMDIIFMNQDLFQIHTENNPLFDNWFMFQRLLL